MKIVNFGRRAVSFALCATVGCSSLIFATSCGKSKAKIVSQNKAFATNDSYSLDEIDYKPAVSDVSYDGYGINSSTGTVNNYTEVKGKTKVSDYVKNTDVWYTPSIADKSDFIYEAQALSYKAWNTSLLKISSLNKQICDTTDDFRRNVTEFEWTSNDVLPLLNNNRPTTRKEALSIVQNYLAEKTEGKNHVWAEMESFMRYQHYAAESGFDILGCEVGANIPGSNVSIAFTRGAARQYNRAWFVDFSLWGAGTEGIGGSMLNYSGDTTAFNETNEAMTNNELGGQGMSATRRNHLYAYMSGARWLINEAGGNAAFYPEVGDDGYYKLTPHGLVFQEVYDFTQRNPDRGWNYTPFAVVLDYYHGLPFGLWNGTNVFQTVSANDGDTMTTNVLNTFYPGWNKYAALASNQLVNTPYGDTADVLLQNASSQALNSYPSIILSGDIKFQSTEIERYREYVKQGGVLVMNTAYLDSFPEFKKSDGGDRYEITSGSGKVIVYGGDYDVSELSGIISDLSTKFIPFEINGDVQYLMNVKEGSLVLTLINNNGVTKETSGLEKFDLTQTQDVKITYTGGNKVLEVRDWLSGEKLSSDAEQTITLAPGDIKVIEFVV